MSAPEEIVCETVEAYEAALAEHGVSPAVMNCPDFPASYTTYKAVRIVYRPTTLSRCPRCGSSDRNTYIHSSMPPHDFHAPCFHDGDYHPWHAAKDVAPRDEAREAFEKWLRESRWDVLYVGSERERLYAAFFGGRASVKP